MNFPITRREQLIFEALLLGPKTREQLIDSVVSRGIGYDSGTTKMALKSLETVGHIKSEKQTVESAASVLYTITDKGRQAYQQLGGGP